MKTNTSQRGFFKITVVLLVTLLTLVLSGFSIGERIGSEQVTKLTNGAERQINNVWEQYPAPYWQRYAQPYASYLWQHILVGTIQQNIEMAIQNVAAGKPTQIEILLNLDSKNNVRAGTTTAKESDVSTTSSKVQIPPKPFQTKRLNF